MNYEDIPHDSDIRDGGAVDVDTMDDEVDTMDDEEVIPEPVADQPTRSRRRPPLRTLIGGALIVLLAAALVVSLIGWSGSRSQQGLRHSALEAAGTYGVYLSSYDYKNLDGPTASWTEVDHHSTPSFRKDFDSTRSSLKKLVTDYKATAKGKVISAGLSSVTSSRAVALLFIDQTVTNTAQKPGTTTQPLRVELVMTHQHGQWLIDKLEVPK
ncbi:MAG TPA: hypothetical protein VFN68_07865 [Acidimicrobiales bacterium]|nr:hypothetical protein [Acidimicrobiales bacterium]